jgi:hypothetical protein
VFRYNYLQNRALVNRKEWLTVFQELFYFTEFKLLG